MSHALLAALLVASSTATAQVEPDAGTPPPAPAPAASTPAAPEGEAVSREDLEAAKRELREDIRAEAARNSLDAGEWTEELTEEKKKLEVFSLGGYFRLRPTLFYKFDLGKQPGQELFPRSPRSAQENTQSFATMRVRLEPTFNISEQVALKLEVLGLDNLVLGSNADTLYAGDTRNLFTLFSESQDPAVDTLEDSIKLRRAYGQVDTPVGILRFGRMGSHWGLGMLRNDGTCFDCDFGDTVDRIQFVTEPIDGWYVTPMLDFNSEGAVDGRGSQGEPVDLTQSDDSHSWVLAIARRDTDAQIRSKLDNNQGVLQYGLHFTYRTQNWEYVPPEGTTGASFIPRSGTLYIPDFWLRYEERTWRLEVELAGIFGSIGNRALAGNETAFDQSLRIAQFGGVVQGEVKAMKNKLSLGLEVGVASGDKAPGFGNYPGRAGTGTNGASQPGDPEGPQYQCDNTGGCSDNAIRNFRFNRDYRVDLILWREILGGVTDAFYVRPQAKYSVAEGFDIYARLIYSQALYSESTPSVTSSALGIEVNAGVDYATEDGFVAGIAYGILFPMGGLQELDPLLRNDFETPQTIRGWLGLKF